MVMPRKRPLKNPNQYYVYVWRYRGKVIYVGQGKNNRGRPDCKASWSGRRWELVKLLEERNALIRAEIIPCKSQQASRTLESKLIAALKPKFNRAPGYGGYSGMHSEIGLNNIRECRLGRRHSKKIRAAISRRLKGNIYAQGLRHSQETKEKISLALKGRKTSQLCRRKSRERAIKRNWTSPPRKGKTNSPEHRRKISVALKLFHSR